MRKKKPIKKYKSLKKAMEIVGFEVDTPKRFKLKEIYVINEKALELRYSSVIVRKSKYDKANLTNKGIVSEYKGTYPNDCYKGEFRNENGLGFEYWNGSAQNPKTYLAVWDDLNHEYSYSVYAKKGIKPKSMLKWQKYFK